MGVRKLVDIHCHILHGADDGSGDLTDSVEMARLAAKSGTKALFATPHCNMPGYFENYRCNQLESKFDTLRNAISEHGIKLTVYIGHEIFLGNGFMQRLRKGELMTLNGSRYALVEFDFYEQSADAYKKVSALAAEGYVPIVAHPERYAFVAEDEGAVKKLRRLGALIQINSGSLSGSFGKTPAAVANDALRKHLADFIASDAHSQYSRTPDLSRAHEYVCENFSYDYADVLFRTNPQCVINNDEIR